MQQMKHDKRIKWNKPYKKVWSAILIAIGATLCSAIVGIIMVYAVVFASLFFLLVNGDPGLKEDENQYILSGYANWEEIQLDDSHKLLIPEEWELVKDGTYLYLLNGEEMVAQGWVSEHVSATTYADSDGFNTARKNEEMQLLHSMIDFVPVKTKYRDYWLNTSVPSTSLHQYVFEKESGEVKAYYFLCLTGADCYYKLSFGPFDKKNDRELLDEIVGIAYSYENNGK